MSATSTLKRGRKPGIEPGFDPGAAAGTAVAPENSRRRFVYNGEPGASQSEYLTRGNRPLKRRKKSPFRIVALIVMVSALTVFYVWNKITVNHLAADVEELGTRLKKVQSMNEIYRAEINRKSNLDKITRLASDRLQMVFPRDPANDR
jgi:cell division protein FtsB